MSDETSPRPVPCRFPTTAWDLVGRLQDESPDDPSALNDLVAPYWRPVFYFLRTHGYPLHQAEDLTQEFFLRFLDRDWLRRADPQRGRFRTFLLTLLTRFLSDEGPERAPCQQRFEREVVSIASLLADEDRSFQPATRQTPETVFMQQWAAAVVAEVLGRLARACEVEGKAAWFAVFAASHSLAGADGRVSQQRLGEQYGLTRDQVRYALEQTEARFEALLRAELRGQVSAGAEVEAEIRELQALLDGE